MHVMQLQGKYPIQSNLPRDSLLFKATKLRCDAMQHKAVPIGKLLISYNYKTRMTAF